MIPVIILYDISMPSPKLKFLFIILILVNSLSFSKEYYKVVEALKITKSRYGYSKKLIGQVNGHMESILRAHTSGIIQIAAPVGRSVYKGSSNCKNI